MKNLGYYNGKYDEIEKMQIPMTDRVCQFGDGIYDATYAHNHKIFDMDAHITRFYNSARLLDLEMPIERPELEKLLADLVLKVDDGDQFVYMQVTRGSGLRGHIYAEDIKANLWITLTPSHVADTYKPIDVITYEDKRFYYCNILGLFELLANLKTPYFSFLFHSPHHITDYNYSQTIITISIRNISTRFHRKSA